MTARAISNALVLDILISLNIIKGDGGEHGQGDETQLRVIWIRQSGSAPGSGLSKKVSTSAVKNLAWGGKEVMFNAAVLRSARRSVVGRGASPI